MEAVRNFSEDFVMDEKLNTYKDRADGLAQNPNRLATWSPNAGPSRFRIEDWIVDPATSQMVRGDKAVRLEPKVMDLLTYLAKRAGRLVTRDDIEDNVWADVIVGYDTVTGAIQKLRKAFSDDARNPRIIETIPKKGYRLVATVQLHVEPDIVSAETGTPNTTPQGARPWVWGGVAAALLVVIAGTALLLMPDVRHSAGNTTISNTNARSIAVLPFQSLGSGQEHTYFADGLADDLITGLAKNPRLLVIARDSSFLYRGGQIDIRQVAERLKVRYLLRGTVRRFGNNIRVNAQLVDTSTGTHAWAEQFDLTTREIFSLQRSITHRIENALSVQVSTGAQQDFSQPATKIPQAYDSFLQGRHRFYNFANKSENAKARTLFKLAIEHDATFAMAYAMLAWTHAFDAMNGWSDRRSEALKRAKELADKALSLQPILPIAYFVRGLVYREQGEYVKALVEAENAINQDANYANGQVLLATLLYYAGRPEEGLKRIQKAIKLNPHHPYNYAFHLGQAYYILGRYTEAIKAFQKGVASNPTSERLHVWLAAAYAQSGNTEDASWEVEEVLTNNPDFALTSMRDAFPFKVPGDRSHFLAGLKKAGFTD